MADLDLSQLLASDMPTPEEETAAKVAALKRTKDIGALRSLGLLSAFSGSQTLAPLAQMSESQAQGIQASGDREAALRESSLGRRFQKALETQRFKEGMDEKQREFGLRERDLAENRAMRLQLAGQGREDKDFKNEQGAFDHIRQAITASRGNPVLVDNTKRLYGIQRLRTLGEDENGQPKELASNQYREFASALAAAISPGSTSDHQINELAQRTLGMDAAKALSYITSHPQARGVKDFVRQGLETGLREEAVVGAQNLQAISDVVPSFAPTLKRYPSAWGALRPHGITPDMFEGEELHIKKKVDPIAAGRAAVKDAEQRFNGGGAAPAPSGGVRIQLKGQPETAKEVTPEQAKRFLADPRFEAVGG